MSLGRSFCLIDCLHEGPFLAHGDGLQKDENLRKHVLSTVVDFEDELLKLLNRKNMDLVASGLSVSLS